MSRLVESFATVAGVLSVVVSAQLAACAPAARADAARADADRATPDAGGRFPASPLTAHADSAAPDSAAPDSATPDGTPRLNSPPPTPPAHPCGSFRCRRFPSASDALDYVLAVDVPRALGVGESHALAHHGRIESATTRFGRDLLPRLAPRTRALVVELLAPPTNCAPQTTQEVQREERKITQGQASTNQNEFVALGHRARELGITPYVLRASCADLDAIGRAGDDGVLVMMETIARRTTLEFERHLGSGDSNAPPLAVAYGGALHNDLAPRPGRETWSYGPAVRDLTRGSYTELDLIVPEHIADSEGWRALPWYGSLPELDDRSAVLLELAPRSWVLFFPRTPGG